MGGIFDIFGDIGGFLANKEALEEAQEETQNRINALNIIKPIDEKYNVNQYATPEDIKSQQISLEPGTRENQLAALGKMQALANSHAATQSDYERQQAMMGANRNAQNQSQSIMQNAAARNQGGGGLLEYMMRNQNAQDNSNSAGQLGMQAAGNAALERLQAQGMYTQGLGQLRNQDTQLAGQNADIFNKFSTLNAERARDVSQRNTDLQNQAQQINYGRDVNNFNQQMQKWNAAGAPHGETMTNIGATGKNLGQFTQNLAKWTNSMGNMAMGMGGGGAGEAMGGMGGEGGGMGGMGDFNGGGAMSSPYAQMAMKNSTKGGSSIGGNDNDANDTWNWYS